MKSTLIARMTFRLIIRDKEALFWMLLMPLVFTFFFSLMMGGDHEPRPTIISVVDEDRGPFSRELIGDLESEDIKTASIGDRGEADSLLASGEITRYLLVPEGLSDSIPLRRQTELEFIVKGGERNLRADLAEVKIYQAIFGLIADLLVAETVVADAETSPPGLFERYQTARAQPDRVTLVSEGAGPRPIIPSGIEHILPGMMVMFILLTMLTGGAATLVEERRTGVLARTFLCPVMRSDIIIGKTLGHLALGIFQTTILIAAGVVLFRFPLFQQRAAGMSVLLLAYVVAAAALGIVFGAYFRSPDRAACAGVITTLAMAALGGCWWPIEVVPRYMQYIARLLPTGWAIAGLHRLFFFGGGVTAVLPHALILLCFAALFLFIATRKLRIV